MKTQFRVGPISSRSYHLETLGITAVLFINLSDCLDKNLNPAGWCTNDHRSSTRLVRNMVVFPSYVIKAYRGSGGVDPPIRNLGNGWR